MRKFLPVIALMLLLFSCSKEEFSVASLSLHSNDSISIEEGRERRDSVLILSASLSDEDASYSFRAVSPDGDLSWEGPFDGSGVRRAELEITPGASFPEGTYSIIIYSDKGTEYSGSMEYTALADRIGVLIGGQLEGIVPSDRLYTSSWPESVRAFLGLNMQRSDPHDPGIAVHPFARAL